MKVKFFIVILLVLSILLVFNNDKDNKVLENNKEENLNKTLAVLLEQEDGKYEEVEDNTWKNKEGYEFDKTLSKCENGSKLSYNKETKKIELHTTSSDKCYVYFSKIKPLHEICNDNTLACVIAKKQGQAISGLPKDTEYNNKEYSGELLLHDSNSTDETIRTYGADDGGYRYSGDNPNNFVCFGPGAEGYSNGEGTCPDENLYRIIGVFPFDENGNQLTKPSLYAKYLVKLIQSEYATHEQLGIESIGTPYTHNDEYTSFKRVKDIPQDGFYWNKDTNAWLDENWNYWEKNEQKSTLNQILNDSEKGYLHYLYNSQNEEQKGINWTSKIATVKWNVGGWKYIVTPKEMYIGEMANSNGLQTVLGIKAENQIGLMYVYDYGFASDKSNWKTNLSQYNTNGNIQKNWLFNGISEWFIQRYISSGKDTVYVLTYLGVVSGSNNIHIYGNAVRPTFYLNEDIQYVGGDGTAKTPYKISIN